MRALVQRVTRGQVDVLGPDGGRETVGRIGPGLVVLVGVTPTDDEDVARRLAGKVVHLRVFDDEDGVANRSLLEVGGAALVISQFTLYADTRKGRRPSYLGAAAPEQAEPLVETVIDALRDEGVEVASGRFRTHMQVELVNDGPMTFSVEVS